jgi:hypothetical protein
MSHRSFRFNKKEEKEEADNSVGLLYYIAKSSWVINGDNLVWETVL